MGGEKETVNLELIKPIYVDPACPVWNSNFGVSLLSPPKLAAVGQTAADGRRCGVGIDFQVGFPWHFNSRQAFSLLAEPTDGGAGRGSIGSMWEHGAVQVLQLSCFSAPQTCMPHTRQTPPHPARPRGTAASVTKGGARAAVCLTLMRTVGKAVVKWAREASPHWVFGGFSNDMDPSPINGMNISTFLIL